MSDDRPSVDDPYLRPLLDAVDEFHVVIGVQDQMRQLILKAYQQGRARVLRDLEQEALEDNGKDVTAQFAQLRAGLNKLEQRYLQQLKVYMETPALTPEQAGKIAVRIQQMLLKQARRNSQ